MSQICALHLCNRCGSWGGPLAAAVYLPLINRTQSLPPLAAEDAWMDALQLQWEAEEAVPAADTGSTRAAGVDAASTVEDLAAAGALLAARQAVQAAFDRCILIAQVVFRAYGLMSIQFCCQAIGYTYSIASRFSHLAELCSCHAGLKLPTAAAS